MKSIARRSHLHSRRRLPHTLMVLALALLPPCLHAVSDEGDYSTEAFAREIENTLPREAPYAYHQQLSTGPIHRPRRSPDATPRTGELTIAETGWTLHWNPRHTTLLKHAVADFQDYLKVSMDVTIAPVEQPDFAKIPDGRPSIIVGTREELPEYGAELTGPKDYAISVATDSITVCGFDERGAMYGLYNLEARMNLREGPFLPADLQTTRHSLYDTRMVQSWMGWMEFPDALLAHLAHDGFDAVFASVYTNPNGDRTTADSSTDFYARLMARIRHQDPARVRSLIDRAKGYGIKVYTPIIYQYVGTPESEAELRRLVRELLQEFPDIEGYVLLTEGFWYKKWGGGHGASKEYIEDWARNWCYAVGVVAEECHKVNPDIEILPWEYNIDFRPQNVATKEYFIEQLPQNTTPLLTWENGKSFEIDGFHGHLKDYAINQVGPAEVTAAQIAKAHQRGMRVFSNAQTFSCGAQLQTVPYHPFPQQWHERYEAMERYGIEGTLESWSSGYVPNFITEFRAWYCWSDGPARDELLLQIAARDFGAEQAERVVKAWDLFSQGVRLVPDTGPYMGTTNAIGNPIFFEQPPARTATFRYSWMDQNQWMGYLGAEVNPYWPFTVTRLVFIPDFSNGSNRAESYARGVSGIAAPADTPILPTFLKYLRLATDTWQEGLDLYREAALNSPSEKRVAALKEVIIAEQLHRMLMSNQAILTFESLRLDLMAEEDVKTANTLLDTMTEIIRSEIARTERALLAMNHDSRIGFQYEVDYVYTPYSMQEKLRVLQDTLDRQLPSYRAQRNGE